MKLILTIATFLVLNLGFSQTTEHSLMKSSRGNLYISMKYSPKYDLTYIANQSGIVLITNANDSIIEKLSFPVGGFIQLDYTSTLGAFCGYDNIIRIFDQETFNVLDSVTINDNRSTSTFIAWFTKSGIFIGNNQYNYKYNFTTKKTTEIKELSLFKILDYHFESNKLILGRWDNSLIGYDFKIKTIFLSSANEPSTKKLVMSTKSSLQSAYFMVNATKLIAKDVNNIYIFDFHHYELRIPTNDSHIYNMNKTDDNTVVLVTPYRGHLGLYTREMIFLDVNSNKITQTISVKNPPYLDNLFINRKKNNIYMVSLYDGIESSIIVIR